MTFKTFFNTLPHYIPNAIFRVKCYFNPQITIENNKFMRDFELSVINSHEDHKQVYCEHCQTIKTRKDIQIIKSLFTKEFEVVCYQCRRSLVESLISYSRHIVRDTPQEQNDESFEEKIYRYAILDNCTCKKIMDKDNKYIESITKADPKCFAHNDDWGDDDEDDDCCNMCDDMDAVEAEDRAVDQQNNFIRGK